MSARVHSAMMRQDTVIKRELISISCIYCNKPMIIFKAKRKQTKSNVWISDEYSCPHCRRFQLVIRGVRCVRCGKDAYLAVIFEKKTDRPRLDYKCLDLACRGFRP